MRALLPAARARRPRHRGSERRPRAAPVEIEHDARGSHAPAGGVAAGASRPSSGGSSSRPLDALACVVGKARVAIDEHRAQTAGRCAGDVVVEAVAHHDRRAAMARRRARARRRRSWRRACGDRARARRARSPLEIPSSAANASSSRSVFDTSPIVQPEARSGLEQRRRRRGTARSCSGRPTPPRPRFRSARPRLCRRPCPVRSRPRSGDAGRCGARACRPRRCATRRAVPARSGRGRAGHRSVRRARHSRCASNTRRGRINVKSTSSSTSCGRGRTARTIARGARSRGPSRPITRGRDQPGRSAHDLAEQAHEGGLEFRLRADRRRRRDVGRVRVDRCHIEINGRRVDARARFRRVVHRSVDRECHAVHLVVALANPQVDVRLVDDLLQLRHGLVDLGLGRRGGRRLCAEALGEIRRQQSRRLAMLTSPGNFVRIDTFDLFAGNRCIVEELGRVADRRENLARVEIARRDSARERRASRGREHVGGQGVPLAVDLDPCLAAAGTDLGIRSATCPM